MRKNVLLRTNLFICAIIVMGFLMTSIVSYYSNNGIFKQDIEHISSLTSEGIFHQIDSIFAKPINISLTMANDSLLKTFLTQEEQRGGDEDYIRAMRDYLLAYREQYEYDSVFLVSAGTSRYYHFEQGVDRILKEGDPENVWYYTFLEDTAEYALNIDNDEVKSADNSITIFINCKIYDGDGSVMGVVGVGFDVDTLQKMFREYEETFQLRAYLVDEEGNIELSTTQSGFVKQDLFADCGFGEYKEAILSERDEIESFWYSTFERKGFVLARYIPNLNWHLIIDNDTTALESRLNIQFIVGVAVVLLVLGCVLFIITGIIRKYNAEIIALTVDKEKAHRTVFQTETEKLYENIYEIDITHNRPASEATVHYFESLGVPDEVPYDEALEVIAREQIKEEYRQGYTGTFSTEHVLEAYGEGRESLDYDFMITNDNGATYYWMRITARIFYWKEDQSVRMLVYRQNIDSEKQREARMAEKMLRDSLSGLYNKAATQELIKERLACGKEKSYAFFIVDIDCFKAVNDTCGHAFGDLVITAFAGRMKAQFREEDIVGRIGGDEFVVFAGAPSPDWVKKKARTVALALQFEFSEGERRRQISASVGVAVAPESGSDFETLYRNADTALYQTKKRGKKGFTVYSGPQA